MHSGKQIKLRIRGKNTRLLIVQLPLEYICVYESRFLVLFHGSALHYLLNC